MNNILSTFGVDLIEVHDLTSLNCDSWSRACCPFAVSPSKYIEYAREDLKQSTDRGNLNAFHNAKRGIDCQIDLILHNLGLFRRHTNAKDKLEILENAGAAAPSILQQIIRQRNLLEHEYENTTRRGTEDAVDIAELFVQATQQVSNVHYLEWEFWSASIKVGGTCEFVYGLDETQDQPVKRSDFLKHHHPNGEQPSGIRFDLYKSHRSDTIDPRQIIQSRSTPEEYLEIPKEKIDELRESVPELFCGEIEDFGGRDTPSIDWSLVEAKVGMSEIGCGVIWRSDRDLYLRFVRLMVHGMKNFWAN